MEKEPITIEGLKKLKEELEDLKRQRKFHNFVYISLDSLTGVAMNTEVLILPLFC